MNNTKIYTTFMRTKTTQQFQCFKKDQILLFLYIQEQKYVKHI